MNRKIFWNKAHLIMLALALVLWIGFFVIFLPLVIKSPLDMEILLDLLFWRATIIGLGILYLIITFFSYMYHKGLIKLLNKKLFNNRWLNKRIIIILIILLLIVVILSFATSQSTYSAPKESISFDAPICRQVLNENLAYMIYPSLIIPNLGLLPCADPIEMSKLLFTNLPVYYLLSVLINYLLFEKRKKQKKRK